MISTIAYLLSAAIGCALAVTFAPDVRRWWRRRKYARQAAALPHPEPQRLTDEQEIAAIRQVDLTERSARADAFITRYCADMLRAGVPHREAYEEGKRVWDDINLVG